MKLVALAGGVGAAKFLRGLTLAFPSEDLTVVGNTGDDAVIHGLHVSPDLDIVSYTLAGLVSSRGWGYKADTTHALDQLRKLGAPAWFTIGDRDLGTHLARTGWLREGITLSDVTDRIRTALGVKARIIPMSDQRVSTKLITEEGVERDFQEYFVKLRHSEQIRTVWFQGAEDSKPAPGVIQSIASADRILVCPSNPVLSIGPILAVPGVREAVASRRDAVFAISPIVQGSALKGPAAKLLPIWGVEASAGGVAGLYASICGHFVLDDLDARAAAAIRRLGLEVLVADTVMKDEQAASRLAEAILSVPLPTTSAMP